MFYRQSYNSYRCINSVAVTKASFKRYVRKRKWLCTRICYFQFTVVQGASSLKLICAWQMPPTEEVLILLVELWKLNTFRVITRGKDSERSLIGKHLPVINFSLWVYHCENRWSCLRIEWGFKPELYCILTCDVSCLRCQEHKCRSIRMKQHVLMQVLTRDPIEFCGSVGVTIVENNRRRYECERLDKSKIASVSTWVLECSRYSWSWCYS